MEGRAPARPLFNPPRRQWRAALPRGRSGSGLCCGSWSDADTRERGAWAYRDRQAPREQRPPTHASRDRRAALPLGRFSIRRAVNGGPRSRAAALDFACAVDSGRMTTPANVVRGPIGSDRRRGSSALQRTQAVTRGPRSRAAAFQSAASPMEGRAPARPLFNPPRCQWRAALPRGRSGSCWCCGFRSDADTRARGAWACRVRQAPREQRPPKGAGAAGAAPSKGSERVRPGG